MNILHVASVSKISNKQPTAQLVSTKHVTVHATVTCDAQWLRCRVFSWGGLGVPPSGKNFVNPPSDMYLSLFLDQSLSPPPAEVRPRKFEKFKHIFCVKFDYF